MLELVIFRKELGEDLVIVVLSMSSKERRERVLLRHDGNVSLADKMDVSFEYKNYKKENTFRNFTALCQNHGAGGGKGAEDSRS